MTEGRLSRLVAFDRQQAGRNVCIAGIDEAGRGPLAGPVVAAAVILLGTDSLEALNDSKQLSAKRREDLYREVSRQSIIGIGLAGEKIIDEINIYQATRLAMKQAVLALSRSPDLLLIDGNMKLDLPMAQKAVVRGDGLSASIAAASIVAKVYRDARMKALDLEYPGYGFAAHKGYGTAGHLEALEKFGPSPVHRRSFSPVKERLLESSQAV